MLPKYLKLRGFEGIYAGLGKHEIEIDFSVCPDGITVFDAPNGSGKTTIMDNMHHYRLMPSRVKDSYSTGSFSYYDNCYGNDALKIFISETDGVLHKSEIHIDAEKRKQECYFSISEDGGTTWIPSYEGGSTEMFDMFIEEQYGSPALFFLSNFRAQNAKSISDYGKADAKELFTELLNITHIKEASEKAGAVKKHLSDKHGTLLSEKQKLTEVTGQKNGLKTELADKNAREADRLKEIAILEEQRRTVETALTDVEVKLSVQQERLLQKQKMEAVIKAKKARIAELDAEKTTITKKTDAKIAELNGKIASVRELAAIAPKYKESADKIPMIEDKVSRCKEAVRAADNKLANAHKVLLDIATAEKSIKTAENELQKIRLKQKNEVALLKQAIERMQQSAERLEQYNLPCTDTMQETCVFLKDAVKDKKGLPGKIKELEAAEAVNPEEAKIVAVIENIRGTMGNTKSVTSTIGELQAKKEVAQAKLDEYESMLARGNRCLAKLLEIEQSTKLIPEYEAQINSITAEATAALCKADKETKEVLFDIEGLQKEVDGIIVDESITEYRQWLISLIDYLHYDVSEERNALQMLNREIGEIEKSLKTVEDAENELVAVKAQVKTLADEIAEWTILEKGLGNNGVIALTISDAGPAISATANELLNVYGGRFTVRIDTQDIKKDKKSLKETLDIMVFDAKTNKEASIKKKSGGQKAWILDAVAKAIGIYNKMANGIRCDTLYTDEVDGALDFKKKTEFFAMKREALKMGGYKKEFCISHTKELCDMADAVIKLGPAGVSITTN